jgi:single-stranded DNA-binding protein
VVPPDTNLVVLVGTLAAPADVRRHPSGVVRLELTVATRSTGPPRRVDAIPVIWWDPPPAAHAFAVGTRLSIVGGVRRRFWATEEGRQSRLEVHASLVEAEPAD